MKHLSIRSKITLWFAAALVIVVSLTYVCILSVSNQVLQKTIKDNLIETVENNMDEVEYYESMDAITEPNDVDYFIRYGDAFLEIDDDFLDSVNQVYTALYNSDLFMLYGENPVAKQCASLSLQNMTIQTVKAYGVRYYVFDRELTGEGLGGLWLRGVVSEKQGKEDLSTITMFSMVIMPVIVAVAIYGGSLIAKRALEPIQKISETVEHISRGNDLKKRIELDKGDDELHLLAEQFNSMFARLDDSFEKEKRFTSDVSHELRTPMSVIMAQCEYSMDENSSLDEYAESIQSIYSQGQKMTVLINQMLDIARLEMRPENYPKERVDLSALTDSICKDMALIKEKGIAISSHIDAGLFISGNPGLLARAISNLISNAYHYGKDNGHIDVSLKKVEEQVVLTVSDDGIGIAEENIPKIFDRFYREDSSRTQNGTGLGLSITKEIVQFHGGTIEVKSLLGIGSTFTVIFPSERGNAL